ncbi:MAG: NAD-dependent epimerase/dehydratase family protein [Gammaproteobacteria bacterium]|nr:NAD-dependent epimerase/dehydratase family protein [Gammaproteobacteria bacterium]
MKVLVTGANGFIGGNLCRHLAAAGDEVTALVRPSGDRRSLADLPAVRVASGDITARASLAGALAGAEIVYHAAGYVSDWGPWRAFCAGNVEGVRNVIEAARAAGVRRVVHVSTVSCYGFSGGVDIGEDTPFTPRPRDRYITSKAAGERLALGYNGDGIEVTAIRPGTVYGPHDRTTTVKLAEALEAGRFGYVDGGRHLMAPCHVDNLVTMLRGAGESPAAPGEAFNAVDDGRVTWREFIGWMCADLGCPEPWLSLPHVVLWPVAVLAETGGRALGLRESPLLNTYRLRAVMKDTHYSTAKAARLLGWRPSLATREGVARAIAWYRSANKGKAA